MRGFAAFISFETLLIFLKIKMLYKSDIFYIFHSSSAVFKRAEGTADTQKWSVGAATDDTMWNLLAACADSSKRNVLDKICPYITIHGELLELLKSYSTFRTQCHIKRSNSYLMTYRDMWKISYFYVSRYLKAYMMKKDYSVLSECNLHWFISSLKWTHTLITHRKWCKIHSI